MDILTVDSPPDMLVKTINHLQKRATEGGDVSKEVVELRSQMQQLSEAQAAHNLARDVPSGNSDLMRFQGRDVDVKSSPASYVTGERGAVALRGHRSAEGAHRPGLLDGAPTSEYQAELQRLVCQRNLVRQALRVARPNVAVHSPDSDAAIVAHLRAAPGEIAALRELGERIWSGSSGKGIDIIPETLLPGLERKLELYPSEAQLFQSRAVPANGRQAYVSGRIRPHVHAVPTTDDPTNDPLGSLTSASATITTKHLAAAAQLDRDIEEDGVLSSIDLIESDLLWSLVYGECDAIVNGHNVAAASHQDALATWTGRSLTAGSFTTDHRTLFDGLRRLSFAKSTASSYAAVTGTEVVRQLMADIGPENIGKTVIMMSFEYFLGVAIKWADFLTWEKVGPNAALLNGVFGQNAGPLPNQVGFVFGVPVVLSPCLTGDLNASGVYDNTTTTKTGALIVNRERYTRWILKNAMVETDVNIRNNTRDLVARRRLTFREAIPGLTAEKNVAYAYNLPKA